MAIAIDFDGTITQYEGWKGWEHTDPPIEGAIAFIKALSQIDDVVIFSVRAGYDEGKKAIQEWVDENGLTDHIKGITAKKLPQFIVMIDDRGIRFENNYREILKQVMKIYQEE